MELAAVLEIGVEDLPPLMTKDVLAQFKEKGEIFLREERIKYKKITTWGSSQRLILYIEGIASSQEDTIEKEFGPPKNVVFTPEGKYTEAGRRYLEAKGAKESDLGVETLEKGEYVYIKRYRKGEKTISILPHLFKKLIIETHFPKSMRWGKDNFSFGRPIRYITALLGKEVVEFELAGIKSSRKSRGHRYLYPKFIDIPSAFEYPKLLRKMRVIFDPEERREKIKNQIQKIIYQLNKKGCNAKLLPDDELLEELTFLTEHPTVFIGEFDARYLSLPSFILKECLREYQKHFAVVNKKGILPFFIGIRDGGKQGLQNIIEGNKKVLHARFNDAQFFYQEDCELPLEKKVSALKKVIVQEKLGSYYDKVKRLVQLSEKVLGQLKIPEEVKRRVRRAAYLCKADLVTNIVREFPELQGIAGKEYALKSGEEPLVAKAIEEHRKPRFNGDNLPQSMEGALLAILDKIDTLTGAFWAGFIPSGSEDPWGLRREAQGVIEIILNKRLDLSLTNLIKTSMELYGNKPEAQKKLREFFNVRLVTFLKELGVAFDQINAVMKVGGDNIVDLFARAQALQNVAKSCTFKEEVIAIVRLLNILKQARDWRVKIPCEVSKKYLIEKEEKKLYQRWRKIRGEVDDLLDNREYTKAYKKLSSLKDLIHDFFEKVLVMSEQLELRNNRLALLKDIGLRVLKIADFSELQVK